MLAACGISPCLQGWMGIVAQPTRTHEMMVVVAIRTSFFMNGSPLCPATAVDYRISKLFSHEAAFFAAF
jgi:hypothetical protein